MRLALAAVAMMGFLASGVSAQETEAPAPTIAPMELAFDNDGLSGPGGDVLRAEMEDAQFIVIGEDHGYAGAPLLVSAFAAEGKEAGFDDYAIEVGPFSTAWLREILVEGGPDALAAQLQGRALALPFLSTREEAEAAMEFLGEGQLWGTDQEFIGSPLIHFEVLTGGSDPAFVADLNAREREAFATGNRSAIFMATVTDEQWAALEAGFAGDKSALDRLGQLRRSTEIYRANFAGRGLENNLDRVAMIREYFLAAYHRAEARKGTPPRVLMKYGAVHASRATTPMNTFDVGALVEGMAAANGMEAVHIAYLPLGGEQTAIRPSPEGFFSTKPADGEKLRELLETAGVDLTPIEASSGHFLIPLEPVKRALRNRGLADLDPMARFVVLGFDYLVTTSDAKPNTPLAQR